MPPHDCNGCTQHERVLTYKDEHEKRITEIESYIKSMITFFTIIKWIIGFCASFAAVWGFYFKGNIK